MAKLTLKKNNQTIKEIPVSKDRVVTIGRDQTNDLQLDNLAVSRFHAKIYKEGWPFYIEDLKTTNGTYLLLIKCDIKDLWMVKGPSRSRQENLTTIWVWESFN
jgi:hypothetical protein